MTSVLSRQLSVYSSEPTSSPSHRVQEHREKNDQIFGLIVLYFLCFFLPPCCFFFSFLFFFVVFFSFHFFFVLLFSVFFPLLFSKFVPHFFVHNYFPLAVNSFSETASRSENHLRGIAGVRNGKRLGTQKDSECCHTAYVCEAIGPRRDEVLLTSSRVVCSFLTNASERYIRRTPDLCSRGR